MNNRSALAAGGGALLFILVCFGLCYFIPTIIAVLRKHKDAPAIAAINILLGWSVVGWFVSFIWSLSDPRGRNAAQTVVINTAQHNTVPISAAPLPHTVPTAVPQAPIDHDVMFWDGLVNKSDPDLLEEYLVRYPTGRFAQLARTRIERTNRAPPLDYKPTPLTADAPNAINQVHSCAHCGASLMRGAKYCEGCGQPIAVATA